MLDMMTANTGEQLGESGAISEMIGQVAELAQSTVATNPRLAQIVSESVNPSLPPSPRAQGLGDQAISLSQTANDKLLNIFANVQVDDPNSLIELQQGASQFQVGTSIGSGVVSTMAKASKSVMDRFLAQ